MNLLLRAFDVTTFNDQRGHIAMIADIMTP